MSCQDVLRHFQTILQAGFREEKKQKQIKSQLKSLLELVFSLLGFIAGVMRSHPNCSNHFNVLSGVTAKVPLNYVSAKRRKWKKLITLITVAVALELFRIDLSLMLFTTADIYPVTNCTRACHGLAARTPILTL